VEDRAATGQPSLGGGSINPPEPRLSAFRAVASGDEQDKKFSQYVAGRAHALRATAYLLCGDWHQAEDLTQSTLLKLYLNWRRLVHHEGLDAYTRRIIVRTFLAERRLLWRRREQVTSDPPDAAAPLGGDVEDRLLIRKALAAVPPRQRAVLVLRFWNDLSVEETAAVLGCSTGTVKSQTCRGLATLRQRLGPHLPRLLDTDDAGSRHRA
jgi:RNA polymerase sigma-70 factor (sigma-E family)